MVNAARHNNFDLIRLVAALQVVWWHGVEHLKIPVAADLAWLPGSFPGVPIFFVVSGYLVAGSYRRSGTARVYFANRALRIFPGLWVCFALTGASIAVLHGLQDMGAWRLAGWTALNLVGLSHTPAELKGYATGSINGSLWTIPVELQFYFVLPLLLWLLGRQPWRWVVAFALALAVGVTYVAVVPRLGASPWAGFALRALPSWLYMFMLGTVLQWKSSWVQRYLEGRFLYWLVGYVAWIGLLRALGINTVGNAASPLALLPLAGVVISAAFSLRPLAHRLLRGHDLSYGVYLYHMPVINAAIAWPLGFGGAAALWVCTVVTLALAALSWLAIERPALRMKPRPRPTAQS